jgi:hypothetical protein
LYCGQDAHNTERKTIGSVGIPARSTEWDSAKTVRAECPYYRKKNPSVVWASLPAIPVGLSKSSAGRMPILQKEKTIGSVGIPARNTGGTQHK